MDTTASNSVGNAVPAARGQSHQLHGRPSAASRCTVEPPAAGGDSVPIGLGAVTALDFFPALLGLLAAVLVWAVACHRARAVIERHRADERDMNPGWETFPAECSSCAYRWQVVQEVGGDQRRLECPVCKNRTGRLLEESSSDQT